MWVGGWWVYLPGKDHNSSCWAEQNRTARAEPVNKPALVSCNGIMGKGEGRGVSRNILMVHFSLPSLLHCQVAADLYIIARPSHISQLRTFLIRRIFSRIDLSEKSVMSVGPSISFNWTNISPQINRDPLVSSYSSCRPWFWSSCK